MAEFQQIKRERLADSIFAALRQAILAHDFLPGERLDIQLLAKKFDVSPTPVNIALHMLASTGFVEIKPRNGTFVASLADTDIAETFDIRRALECLASESAVRNVDEAAIAHLSGLIKEMQRARRGAHEIQYRISPNAHEALRKPDAARGVRRIERASPHRADPQHTTKLAVAGGKRRCRTYGDSGSYYETRPRGTDAGVDQTYQSGQGSAVVPAPSFQRLSVTTRWTPCLSQNREQPVRHPLLSAYIVAGRNSFGTTWSPHNRTNTLAGILLLRFDGDKRRQKATENPL